MSYGNLYRPDRLFLPQQVLSQLARELPTPFYLYDEDGIRKALQLVRGSFCWNHGHRAYIPMKANHCPAVLRIAQEEGFGVLAQSEPELRLAGQLGFSGQALLFHTGAMTEGAIALANALDAVVSFDAPEQLARMEAALPARCLLRYHPEKTKNAALFTGNTEKHKSGMSRAQIFAAAQRLAALGVTELGIHCHLASNAQKADYYPAVAREVFALAKALRQETGLRVTCCDLGGGIGAHPAAPLSQLGALVRAQYRADFSPDWMPAVYTELGRCVLGRHGLLVSRVAEVRERSRRYAVVDASVANLPEVLLRRSEVRLSVVGNCAREGRLVYSVHGCTADAQDRFCDRAMLPTLSPGTLVAFHDAGAYCASMQLCLSMLPPCRSYLYTRAGSIVDADTL